ncbi:MAG: hypothetical protein ACKVGT_06020 [Flavobacteriales bacterium]
MKFSKILFLLVLTLSVISCKNNDDDTAAFNLSNANVAGTHDLTYFTSNVTTTGSIGGQPITVTTNTTADTYQVELTFTESGAYTIIGEFRTTTTSTLGGQPQVEILTLDESGTYQVNEAANTLVFIASGSSLSDSDVNSVTLFNETELRIMFEGTYVEDGDEVIEMTELRFVRQ